MNMVKIQNPEKEYPPNMGQKWTDDEEALLLDELNKNTDINIISQTHNRTIGGINSRRREIAYKMYLKNLPIEEIMKQTKKGRKKERNKRNNTKRKKDRKQERNKTRKKERKKKRKQERRK